MQKSTMIKCLFICRVFLWITALAATVYWIVCSVRLHMAEIFDPAEFGSLFRPVLYTCLVISIASICLSFVLYAISKRYR